MINSIYVGTQNVDSLGNVLFNADRIRTASCRGCGGWIVHEQGSGLFELTKAGKYIVLFSANVSSATTGTISFQLRQNGEFIPGTETDHTVAVANDFEALTNFALIDVPCGTNKTIALANSSGTEMIVEDANIVILKLA